MKERPILFNGEMVRAIQAGTKTQTRRVMKEQPDMAWYPSKEKFHDHQAWCRFIREDGVKYHKHRLCPYGVPGDRLWVREKWNACPVYEVDCGVYESGEPYGKIPKEKPHNACIAFAEDGDDGPWRPSIHMPRWASRILLEVTDVRVERVQHISEEDAIAEGIECRCQVGASEWDCCCLSAEDHFAMLWESINGKRGYGWDTNPLVWVVEFKYLLDMLGVQRGQVKKWPQ